MVSGYRSASRSVNRWKSCPARAWAAPVPGRSAITSNLAPGPRPACRPGSWPASSACTDAAGARRAASEVAPVFKSSAATAAPRTAARMWPVISVVTVCPAPRVQPRTAIRRGPASGILARSRSSVSGSRLPGPWPPATTFTWRRQLTSPRLPGPLSARSIDGSGRSRSTLTNLAATGTGAACGTGVACGTGSADAGVRSAGAGSGDIPVADAASSGAAAADTSASATSASGDAASGRLGFGHLGFGHLGFGRGREFSCGACG